MFSASNFLPTTILQLRIPQMHKNTTKSATVTHDNSTMLPPHCNVKLMPVNNIEPWRVRFKTSNPHQPSSLDRGDHPITKFTTFNTEISHMQEQQPVATFTRENSNPCNLGLYSCPRYFSQQQFERQLNATPPQQGRSTSARFFAKKHQFDPIVQRKNQNHGQTDKILHHPTKQKLGTLQDTLHTKNMAKNTAVAVPKANGQLPETSAPTDRHNPQDRSLLQQETDIDNQTTGQKQQGHITATSSKRIQMEIYAPTDSVQPNRTHERVVTPATLAKDTIDVNSMMTMRYDDDFPPMGVRPKIAPTVTMPQVVERPASFAPPIDYQIAFHSHMIRTFGTFSTLYYEQSHVHLYPSTIRWCQDLSAAAAFHAQYHTHQLILVKEM